VIVTLAFALQAIAPRDHWFGADKLKHFFVSAFTQSVAYSALQAAHVKHGPAMTGALAVTAVVSVGKEIHDRRVTGLFSARDLVWDAGGAGVAMVLLEHSVRRSRSDDRTPPVGESSVLFPLAPAPIFRAGEKPAFALRR
jgi:putative lipoprotein